MAIDAQPTPNPNAYKFAVGRPVGGPASYAAGEGADHPAAAALLEMEGVSGVFMSADFFTLTKTPEADWENLIPAARSILETHYPD